MQQKPKIKRASTSAVFRSYYAIAKKYPWLIVGVFLGATGMQIANITAPLYLRKLFNILATQDHGSVVTQQLTAVLGMIVFWWFAYWIMSRIQHVCNMYFEARVMTDIYSSTFTYLILHSHNFFISSFAGTLTHRVTKFSRAFEQIFDAVATRFFSTFLFVTGATVVLFMHNNILGIALGVWSILFVSFELYLAKIRRPTRAIRSEADSRITGTLSDAVSNHSTITLFSGCRHEQKLFTSVVERWRIATTNAWFSGILAWSGLSFFIIIIQGGLLYAAIILWGQGLLTVGDFVLIQAYLLTALSQLTNIDSDLRRVYDALSDAGEMVEILQTPHEIQDVSDAKRLTVQKGEIEFNRVGFSFKNNKRKIFEDFNLSIHGGEKVALVGTSGAGKSTITKLLLRFHDVQSGSIEIDRQIISQVTQDSLRDAIAFVPQEPILFHRSLMDNIRYGRRDATDEEVLDAAKKAHCHEFISKLSEGYNTFVGERGVKLSGGERQRVAIARAILKNAPILLLDEATSSLDSESEAFIQDALEMLMRGKTVIVIAHRLSTIMKMDRIIVLEGGVVVADGTHNELLAEGGLYHKLWSIQAGGFIADDNDHAEDIIEKDEDDKEVAEDEEDL